VFLLYINKFNTNLGRICFCFSGALGGITIVLEESSICVSCLYKQSPFLFSLRSNYFGIRSSYPGPCRYRPILRPIFLIVRFHSFIHLFNIIQFIKPIPNEPKNSLLVILETPTIKAKISFTNKKGTKGLDKIRKLESTIG